MKVSSVVKMNKQRIRELSQATVTTLEMTTEALHTEVVQAQVVPFDSGNTQNESMFADYSDSDKGIARLVHSNPYARRIYYHPEYNFQTKENPNAKGLWFEDWIDGDKKDFCSNAFKQLYKKVGDV